MTKLFVSKFLKGAPYLFLVNKLFRDKNLSILVPEALLYYVALHLKLASSARGSQLTEIFAYEHPFTPYSSSPALLNSFARTASTTVVYQFHNLFYQNRIFIFVVPTSDEGALTGPKSIAELFATASWLEREVGEMHGICFGGKKDLRNLMLQYGDASAPFQKSYPSIGVKEVVYDSLTDNLVQVPVTTQI